MKCSLSHRIFVKVFILFCTIFIVFNYFIWKHYTELLLTKKYDGGELARMSYHHGSKYFRKNHVDLPIRHFLIRDYKKNKIDLLTLGDSFSFGIGGGKNNYYQDYIASYNNINVANVHPYPSNDSVSGFSPLTNLILLYNSGLLDEIKPKYVLIESVERYCIERYSHRYDFNRTTTKQDLLKYYNSVKDDFDYLPNVCFMNTGNFKFFYYNFIYQLSDKAFGNTSYSVVIKKTSKPLFSAINSNDLLFLNKDVSSISLASDDSIYLLNNNLNVMAQKLASKNIKLYFMPIVDKYNLYHDSIINNPYPSSCFFEKLRKLPKKYVLIDTKQILQEELNRGQKDVFYPDDSHWSWKAPQKIFDQVRFP